MPIPRPAAARFAPKQHDLPRPPFKWRIRHAAKSAVTLLRKALNPRRRLKVQPYSLVGDFSIASLKPNRETTHPAFFPAPNSPLPRVALVKQAWDVFGPWSGVSWVETSPTRLFNVWPGKAVYWELTCMLQADWYIVPVAVEGDYLKDAVGKHPERIPLLQKHTKNITEVAAIPFEDYDLVISFDAILEIPPGLPTLFAYYAQEHWDSLYTFSMKCPLNGYDLFLAHMLDVPGEVRSLPQAVSFPYPHDLHLVRSLFHPARQEVAWVDWRLPITLSNGTLRDPWSAKADAALQRLRGTLEIDVRCRTSTHSISYSVSETPTWGDAAHYYRELAECRYYIAVGRLAGAGQGLAEAAAVGCICIGQEDRVYHRLLCHPSCLCEDMRQMPHILRRLRHDFSLQAEVLAWQDWNLEQHFRLAPLSLLGEALDLKRKLATGNSDRK